MTNFKNDFKIDNYLVDEVAYTISHFTDPWEAARAALIVAKTGFGDCYSIKGFIDEVEWGGFNAYDGIGYFVDIIGNQLSEVICDANWLRENTPENAAFIMWYGK